MRSTVTVTLVLVGAATVYALLPGGTVALLGFEILILMVAWLAMKRIIPATEPAPEDETVAPLRWRSWRRSREPVAGPAPPQLRKVEGLLRFSRRHAFTAKERLVPMLRDLAAERLYARYGIDLEADPDAARAVVGTPGWEIIGLEWSAANDRSGTGPSYESVEAAVSAIERL
jgi:hypothetical protein